MVTIEGSMDFQGLTFGVVVSRFNHHVTTKLLDGALQAFDHYKVASKNVMVVKVPGAFELGVMAQKLITSQSVVGVVCLGCVIRGDTSHYDYVCSESARGIQQVSIRYERPVSFGVLTTENMAQAMDRTGGKYPNKGYEAAEVVLEMVSLFNSLDNRE